MSPLKMASSLGRFGFAHPHLLWDTLSDDAREQCASFLPAKYLCRLFTTSRGGKAIAHDKHTGHVSALVKVLTAANAPP